MHKPVFIIVNSKTRAEAEDLSIATMDKLIEYERDHDWYQGIKASQRWSKDYNYFDTPRLISDRKSKALLEKMLENQSNNIKEWLEHGKEEIEDKGINSWSLSNYSIASGKTVLHIFDGSDWSMGEGIVSQSDLDKLLNYHKTQKNKLWIHGYDIHY